VGWEVHPLGLADESAFMCPTVQRLILKILEHAHWLLSLPKQRFDLLHLFGNLLPLAGVVCQPQHVLDATA
jgi:hypothetical protein